MKEQDSVITVRDKQIKELEAKIVALQEEHKNTLIEIAKKNKVAESASKEVDFISDDQLKKERLKWSGLHLYGGVEVSRFEFQNTSINSELMYELQRIHFGFKAEIEPSVLEQSKYNFNYFLKLRYKFF